MWGSGYNVHASVVVWCGSQQCFQVNPETRSEWSESGQRIHQKLIWIADWGLIAEHKADEQASTQLRRIGEQDPCKGFEALSREGRQLPPVRSPGKKSDLTCTQQDPTSKHTTMGHLTALESPATILNVSFWVICKFSNRPMFDQF